MAGYVQSSGTTFFGGSGTTESVTLNGVAAGNLLAITVAWQTTTSTLNTIAGNSNTYTAVDSSTANGAMKTYYVKNCNSGNTTVTITWSADPGFGFVHVTEVNGMDTTAPLDQHRINSQNVGTGANAVTSGSVTTTANGEYIYSSTYNNNAGGGQSAGTNFTQTDGSGSGFWAAERLTAGSGIQTTAGAIAATYTGTDAFANELTCIMTFKAPAAATGGLTPYMRNPGNTFGMGF